MIDSESVVEQKGIWDLLAAEVDDAISDSIQDAIGKTISDSIQNEIGETIADSIQHAIGNVISSSWQDALVDRVDLRGDWHLPMNASPDKAVVTFWWHDRIKIIHVRHLRVGMPWLEAFEQTRRILSSHLHNGSELKTFTLEFRGPRGPLTGEDLVPIASDLNVDVKITEQQPTMYLQPLRQGLHVRQRVEVINLAGESISAILTGIDFAIGYHVATEEMPSRRGVAPFAEHGGFFNGFHVGCYVQQWCQKLSWYVDPLGLSCWCFSEMGLHAGSYFGPVHAICDKNATHGFIKVLVPCPKELPRDYAGSRDSLLWINVVADSQRLCHPVPLEIVFEWECRGWQHWWNDDVDLESLPEFISDEGSLKLVAPGVYRSWSFFGWTRSPPTRFEWQRRL